MPRRTFAALLSLFVATFAGAVDPDPGVRPLRPDGSPYNFDFEAGNLRDWQAEGTAFQGQPVRGDLVAKRRADMKSQHQGEFWIGGFELAGDRPKGTLTSVPFKVTHPWGSFLIAGGTSNDTCVEIVRVDTKQALTRAAGDETENLKRVAVDLRDHLGKEIVIRLVDRHAGHWGHLNFDDFRFHTDAPKVPIRRVPEPQTRPDEYKFNGLPPEKAAAAMTAPDGFSVTLFAGEPDVHQPVAFCIDDRGRLWVAEAYVYPRRRPSPGPLLPANERSQGDRILIFQDSDGDGKFDKKTVFLEGLNLVSGLEVGFGGAWIGAAPYLLYVPIDASGNRPAGDPQILLDGWGYQDTHETLNAFIWGPDGWLYGCHGVFTHSRVGKPGTLDSKRTPINAGVWRYHPTRHEFEVFSHGTSNPWGLDYNEMGDWFVEACVIPHCFHMIQNGRYHRQGGQHFNPATYADIATIADHRHYVGANPHGGNNRSDSMGGGHAHCGLMCYLGGSWPEEHRNKLFMGNIHGRRINVDFLKTNGATYTASHGKDFLLANDGWARFINFRFGPDGNVFVIDWYDQQACHRNEPEIWDRSNGRIYKVSRRGINPEPRIDMQSKNDAELVLLQLHQNDWYVRHARRILQERYNDPSKKPDVKMQQTITKNLINLLKIHPREPRRIRALWALHSINALTPEVLEIALNDKDPHIRGWAVQLALESKSPGSELSKRLIAMSADDRSPIVRRFLASAAIRLADQSETSLAMTANLTRNAGDATDPVLPLLYWYAVEAHAKSATERVVAIAAESPLMQIKEFTFRRLAELGDMKQLFAALAIVTASDDVASQQRALRAVLTGLKGVKSSSIPEAWNIQYARFKQSTNLEVQILAHSIGSALNDDSARQALLSIVADDAVAVKQRLDAIGALAASRDARLAPILIRLLEQRELRSAAIRTLAGFQSNDAPQAIINVYPKLTEAEKRDAVSTLASRAAYAKQLLDAVAKKRIPPVDVPADIVRQLGNLRDAELDKQVAAVWGVVRRTAADRVALIAEYRKKLFASTKTPDVALGRAIFAKTCQQCHVLFGVGGKVGPDITGANRSDLNYLLENIFDPSAVIPKEYLASRIELKNGRVVTGIVRFQNDATLTVQTATEVLTIAKGDVEDQSESNASMMPDDQMKPFSDDEFRALIAYLQSPQQTTILATVENAADLFNGKDLTGWSGDPKLWRVENGEIVGQTSGLKQNQFLTSQMTAGDFRLRLKVKLVPNSENSGIQFRSEVLSNGEVKGPQADMGAGWWGKLYEEHGRGLLWKDSGEQHVKQGEWNEYEITAQGSKVQTRINGQLCVNLDDPQLSRRGIIAFQLHSGGALEVRFKDLKLEVLPVVK